MEGITTNEDIYITGMATQNFLRRLVIAGLAAIAILVLAGRVKATYLYSDSARVPAYAECYKASRTLDYDRWYSYFNAGDYIDRWWYYLLDDGQYYYLDRGQYNLLGGLSYQLGHPCYPKLFERNLDQAVGFTNRVNTGWFSFYGGQVLISEYDVWCCYWAFTDSLPRTNFTAKMAHINTMKKKSGTR